MAVVQAPPAPSVSPAESPTAPVAQGSRKKRKPVARSVAPDAAAPEAAVAGAVVVALKSVVGSVAQPAKSTATPSLRALPTAVAKLVAASLGAAAPGRTSAKVLTAVALTVAGLVITILHLIGTQAGRERPSQRRRAPESRSSSGGGDDRHQRRTTHRPATPTPTGSRRRAYLVTVGVGCVALVIAGTIWYLRAPPKPSRAEVRTYLANRLAPRPVRRVEAIAHKSAAARTSSFGRIIGAIANAPRRSRSTSRLRSASTNSLPGER